MHRPRVPAQYPPFVQTPLNAGVQARFALTVKLSRKNTYARAFARHEGRPARGPRRRPAPWSVFWARRPKDVGQVPQALALHEGQMLKGARPMPCAESQALGANAGS